MTCTDPRCEGASPIPDRHLHKILRHHAPSAVVTVPAPVIDPQTPDEERAYEHALTYAIYRSHGDDDHEAQAGLVRTYRTKPAEVRRLLALAWDRGWVG